MKFTKTVDVERITKENVLELARRTGYSVDVDVDSGDVYLNGHPEGAFIDPDTGDRFYCGEGWTHVPERPKTTSNADFKVGDRVRENPDSPDGYPFYNLSHGTVIEPEFDWRTTVRFDDGATYGSYDHWQLEHIDG